MTDIKTIGEADVIVIGGGVIGISTGYYLAKKGKKVIIVEKEDICSGASGACDQNIFLQSKLDDVNMNMAAKSSRLYEEIQKDTGEDIEYEKNGGMIFIENEFELEFMQKRIKTQKKAGYKAGLDVEILSHDEIFTKYPKIPSISSNIIAAAYCPEDAHVNSFKFICALVKTIKKYGAKIYLDTPVTGIIVKNGKARGVTTPRGKILSDAVVNACGPYASHIGEMVGIDVPVKPRRGQVIVSEPLPPVIRGGILSTKYIAAKHLNNDNYNLNLDFNLDESGVGLSLSQTKKGNLLIGATREFVGYDTSVTRKGIKRILKNACSILPFLKKVNFIRTFSGLRPYCSTGKPILGKIKGIEGFYIAAGHEGDGISMAPITGKIMTQLICGEKPEFTLESFSNKV